MRIRQLLKYSIFLVFIVIFSQFIYSLRGILSSTPIDFLHYYLASEALLSGQNPYLYVPLHNLTDGMTIVFNYPPTSLLIFWFLALFPIEISRLFWEVIIFLSLIISILITLKILKYKINSTIVFLLLIFSLFSFPVRHTFGMGQVSIIIGFLLILSYFFNLHKKYYLSGLFLSLAISLKAFPLIFLLFYIFNKNYKVVYSTLIMLCIEIFISWCLVGNAGWAKYLIISPTPDIFLTRGHYYEQSLSAFFVRLPLTYNLKLYLFILTEIVILSLVCFQIFKRKDRNDSLIFSLFLIIATFILGFNWQHYFALLLFPYVVIGLKIIKSKNIKLILLFLLSYLLVSFNIKNPTEIIISWGKWGNLFLSHELYGSLILLFLNIWILSRKKLLS